MIDYSECKNITEIKNKLRDMITAEFKEYLVQKYGEDLVSQIGVNEIAFATGYTMVDSHEEEVCAVVKIIAKPWTDSAGEKRQTPAFDRFQEEEDYRLEMAAKQNRRKK